jgi:hypothetical protein
VTSLEFTRSIVIAQLANSTLTATNAILSVYNGRLLAGRQGDTKLYVYSANNGTYIGTIHLPFTTTPGNKLFDAVWARNGNIVYTTFGSSINTVEVTTPAGTLISSTTLAYPRYLSVSVSGDIYMIGGNCSILLSADNGVTWCHRFNTITSNKCHQAGLVNVQNTENTTFDELWMLAYDLNNWILGEYNLRKNHIYISESPVYHVFLSSTGSFQHVRFKFAYDGHETVFLLDEDIVGLHTLPSLTKVLDRPILTMQYFSAINNRPVSLSVDVKRDNQLYVGLSHRGLVSVFTLKYRDDQ